jgi:hypothetical protein
MAGRSCNEKNRGEEEEKETQMRGQGIGIFAICMYTCFAFGHILKKLPPLTSSTRRCRRGSPPKWCRRRRCRLVVGPVVAVKDELGAALGQAGDQRGCNEADHHKEGLRPSGLVRGGGRLRRLEAIGVRGGATAAQ